MHRVGCKSLLNPRGLSLAPLWTSLTSADITHPLRNLKKHLTE